MNTIFVFRLMSGDEVIGEILNPSSIEETGEIIVEWPMIIDWNEPDIEAGVGPTYNFFPILFGATQEPQVVFMSRSLVTYPLPANPSIVASYRHRIQGLTEVLEKHHRLQNYQKQKQQRSDLRGKNTGRRLNGGVNG